MENNMTVTKKNQKQNYHMIQQFHFWAYIYPKELKAESGRGICTPMFIAALFPIAKRWKQPKCPLTDEWVNKMYFSL